MNEQTTLSAEVCVSLPPIAQAYIAFLESQIALLREQVTALQAAVAKLETPVPDTQARAQQNSANSSHPPSSDPPGARPTSSICHRVGNAVGGRAIRATPASNSLLSRSRLRSSIAGIECAVPTARLACLP